MNHYSSHCGSLSEPAIRNGELCEIGYPQRCLQPREACEQSPIRNERGFRTDRLTRLVPTPVRFVLWNDGREKTQIIKMFNSTEFEGIKLSY